GEARRGAAGGVLGGGVEQVGQVAPATEGGVGRIVEVGGEGGAARREHEEGRAADGGDDDDGGGGIDGEARARADARRRFPRHVGEVARGRGRGRRAHVGGGAVAADDVHARGVAEQHGDGEREATEQA